MGFLQIGGKRFTDLSFLSNFACPVIILKTIQLLLQTCNHVLHENLQIFLYYPILYNTIKLQIYQYNQKKQILRIYFLKKYNNQNVFIASNTRKYAWDFIFHQSHFSFHISGTSVKFYPILITWHIWSEVFILGNEK